MISNMCPELHVSNYMCCLQELQWYPICVQLHVLSSRVILQWYQELQWYPICVQLHVLSSRVTVISNSVLHVVFKSCQDTCPATCVVFKSCTVISNMCPATCVVFKLQWLCVQQWYLMCPASCLQELHVQLHCLQELQWYPMCPATCVVFQISNSCMCCLQELQWLQWYHVIKSCVQLHVLSSRVTMISANMCPRVTVIHVQLVFKSCNDIQYVSSYMCCLQELQWYPICVQLHVLSSRVAMISNMCPATCVVFKSCNDI